MPPTSYENAGDAPAVTLALGRLLIAWAPVELLVVAVLARVLRDNGTISLAILQRHTSVARRLDVIKDIAAIARMEETERKEAVTICQEIGRIAESRNKYVHGLYSFSEDGKVKLSTNITSKKSAFMVEIKAEEIQFLAEECRGVLDRVRIFAFRPQTTSPEII